ncbi:molybdenum cofactor biosynthesis protein MoaE [Microlunatus elymi]|uniref:Molybdenum cofactor biosynthesis protein MoaE n=1 Tax=Microlunatus elymi TaxID=2596828 RepID=A0A516PZ77_9ACTN|nr:molybdenum cofactor biosynthesis protein MoaE [Microlunatus elymi]QDP96468.1 molybdenum cofactor biosynthesis protein MoaE [Microlunatus elymi]
MEPVRISRITEQPLSVDRLLAAVSGPRVGGIVIFVGAVRDHDQPAAADAERTVRSLDYTAHPLADQRLDEVAKQAAAIDGVQTVAVEHRVGHLDIGDLAVVIAVGAEHRGEAFAGCRQLIDELKAGVPIWKEQTFADGVSEWVGLP